MGMDPATAALMASILGGSVLGGVTAPQGQKLQSFKGTGPETDPIATTGMARRTLDDYLGATIDRANEPVTMNTTVNPLPSFVGGGLPMSISAPGMDANRMNPALRTSPGLNIMQPTRRRLPGAPADPSTSAPTPPSGEMPPIGGDHDQAAAALELLMGQMGRRGMTPQANA